MKKALLIVVAAFLLLIVGLRLVFKPVPMLPEEELTVVTGEVAYISEGSDFDIFVSLKNEPGSFYINRGLERGLNLEELKEKLTGKMITIKYPEYESVFGGNTHHLSKIELGEEVIFTELKESTE